MLFDLLYSNGAFESNNWEPKKETNADREKALRAISFENITFFYEKLRPYTTQIVVSHSKCMIRYSIFSIGIWIIHSHHRQQFVHIRNAIYILESYRKSDN